LSAEALVPSPDPRTLPADRHVLMVPSNDRYLLIERTGSAPAAGEEIEVAPGDVRSVVRVGTLPGERVACAYLDAPNPSASAD
jgi:hypothetical protein